MQDFVNYKNNYHFENQNVNESAEWSLDIPSLLLGIVFGFLVCLVGVRVAEVYFSQEDQIEPAFLIEEVQDDAFVFEFYEALKNYEVLPRDRH